MLKLEAGDGDRPADIRGRDSKNGVLMIPSGWVMLIEILKEYKSL